MTDDALIQTVTDLAAPLAAAQGLEVWGVEVVRAGRTVVRLFVDTPPPAEDAAPDAGADSGGEAALLSATLDQCAEISRQLGLSLDVADCVDGAYVLEVSTPGLSRPFFRPDQMRPYVGGMVEARLLTPLPAGGADMENARRTWRGLLTAVEDAAFVLAPAGVSPEGAVTPEKLPPVRIPWSAARRVRRLHIFAQPQKPGKRPGNTRRKKHAAHD